MLNKSCFISIVIVLNNVPKYLDNLLENIVNQGEKLGKYELIIINNLPLKKQSQDLIEMFKQYQVINLKNLDFKEIYSTILDICQGEIIIFFDGNYYPDEHWVKQITKPFSDSKINVVTGEICLGKNLNIFTKLRNFYHKFVNQNKFQAVNFYDYQMANIAVRKEFIQQQKYLHLTTIKPEEISFYYRILREIEAEITYNPSAIVYDYKLDRERLLLDRTSTL